MTLKNFLEVWAEFGFFVVLFLWALGCVIPLSLMVMLRHSYNRGNAK